MTQIIINNLSKIYGNNQVLKNINFNLEFNDKIAIVGLNGSGKSTLLKIIDGKESLTSGSLYIAKNTSIGYLNQDSLYSFDLNNDFNKIDKKYLSLLNINVELNTNFSGGELTKLSLCKILSLNPNLLLLDEPTNNLDFEGVKILIKLLKTYRGSLIVVSHDRFFLNSIITKIIEIENGFSREFSGNYNDYRESKKKLFQESMFRYEESKKNQKKVEKSIKKVKEWSNKAHRDSTKYDSSGLKMGVKEKKRAKAKKMDKKIKSDIKRLEKMIKSSEKKPDEEKEIYFQIKNIGLHGKRIMQALDICKNFESKVLFNSSSFSLKRGEKVALFGKNGSGKTTLIKIIEKENELSSGELWTSPNCKKYFLNQDFENLPPNLSIKEYFYSMDIFLNGEQRMILDNIGIEAKHIDQKIGKLSFGEQMKVKLSLAILEENDLIILDEPTNHIDLPTREMLEKTLIDYNGTLIIVSHDIDFLKNICDTVLFINEEKIIKYEMSFKDFAEKFIEN